MWRPVRVEASLEAQMTLRTQAPRCRPAFLAVFEERCRIVSYARDIGWNKERYWGYLGLKNSNCRFEFRNIRLN